LTLLKVIDGSRDDEQEMLASFRHLQIRGEWFSPGQDLLDLINKSESHAPNKPESSGARMRKAGFKPVQLWLTAEQHEQVQQAAELEQRHMTQFFIFHGDEAAKAILQDA
jgi:hypothetical protein